MSLLRVRCERPTVLDTSVIGALSMRYRCVLGALSVRYRYDIALRSERADLRSAPLCVEAMFEFQLLGVASFSATFKASRSRGNSRGAFGRKNLQDLKKAFFVLSTRKT